jgi:hypothetical protein
LYVHFRLYIHLYGLLLSANRLTNEQRRQREHGAFQQSFTLTRHRNNNNYIPSFFHVIYQQLYGDLARRLHVDDIILDFNYERLFKCINIMTNERIRYRFETYPIPSFQQLPMSEYAMALEFYLQIDGKFSLFVFHRNHTIFLCTLVELFYMKTCSFRGARPPDRHGLFCMNETGEHCHGMTSCRQQNCHFCFPLADIAAIRIRQQQHESVVQFSSAQKHQFVSGYQAILNCPTVSSIFD